MLPARMAGGGAAAYQLMTRYNGLCAVFACAALDRGKVSNIPLHAFTLVLAHYTGKFICRTISNVRQITNMLV